MLSESLHATSSTYHGTPLLYTWDNFLVSCAMCFVCVLLLLLLNSFLKTVSEANIELEAVSFTTDHGQTLTCSRRLAAMGSNARAARHSGLLKSLRRHGEHREFEPVFLLPLQVTPPLCRWLRGAARRPLPPFCAASTSQPSFSR